MILIIGAGDVGTNIASDLTETHDVTIVDRDSGRIDALTSDIDVSGIVGDGRSVPVLREADIDRADIVVASTDSDAANIMACNAAKRSGDPHTIARVKDIGLCRTWQSLDGGLGVDTMLCIDVLAAEAVTQTIVLPGARAVDTFAGGQVEAAEFEIRENAPVAGQTIAEADRYASTTFAAILRDDDILIPQGDTVIQSGDCVVVIGGLSDISRFADAVAPQPALDADDDIVIVGGDELGYQIAQQFEARGWAPQIAERDPEQVDTLSTRLQGASIAETDIANIEGFNPDLLANADLVVGAVDDDTNYLLAQLARERDVTSTAAIVDDPEIVEIFESTGIDVVVHPQDIIAGKILQAVYGPGPENVSVFEHDSAEVLEVVVDKESVLTGNSLRDAANQLPAGFVIGAIIRGGQLQLPRGNKIIQTGDRVIAFVDTDVASEIAELI
ncbi:Trk system potassium transporter TrkA [Natronorubrum halophilum]|uniref:Trk system potassium transporter TrkA n=1 Tax=Natronorubrum halophilum TaxID=1702106 RepID=UPI0010C21040|nr:Trk system potassium transporter TrkA [Natronorubrum halophilum]